MKNKNHLFAVVICVLISGCNLFSKPAVPSPTPTPTPAPVQNTGGSTNIHEIAEKTKTSELPFQLYKLLSIEPKNINFSPLSLKMAFSLIYPGTRAGTQKVFEQIFGFSESKDNLQAEYDLAAKAKSDTQELAFANSVWFRNPKSLKEDYKETLKTRDAEVGKMNIDAINEWAAKASHGKIKKALDKLESRTEVVILNSIYLKQKWKQAFSTEKTTVTHFQATPSLSEKVPMLHDERVVRYYEDATAKWIALPYENSPLVMYFALPIKRFDLSSVNAEFTSEQFAKVASQMKENNTTLALPKFKLVQKQSLKETLYRAGYGELFEKGNYSGVTEKTKLQISDVIQAACIEITETGTEAAAISAVTMLEGAARRPILAKSFIADEPFLFVLRNDETKEIYWMGKIYSPLTLAK